MADAVVEKVVCSLFDVAKKEIKHIWNCSENIENLKKEAGKLTGMKGRVQQRIDLARNNGERLLEGVEEWMNKAGDKISEAAEFAEEAKANKTCCNLRFCVNLGALYRYGKMATERTSFLLEHQEGGKGFETCVSLPATTPGVVDLYQIKDLENIHTQKSSLKKIIQAMNELQIVGIVGIGGVGKTTLAKEVAAQMKNQFDHIEFTAISQTVDAKKIKEEVQVAAQRILNGDKVLIILDDVWEELKLDEVGIPCGSRYMNCKILLTSRKRDACEKMKAQKIISVDPLPEEEAWSLFEQVVGMSEWNVDDRRKPVALKIVHECGGLPLFILAVGTALRDREIKTWEAALGLLKEPTDEDDDAEFKREGIKQLKLSYDFLKSEVAKSCFLICSMFPEDASIGFNTLTCYALGLGVFNNLDCSVQQAKNKVQLAVESLKSSFLLLHERVSDQGEEFFNMHDLVRDMAMFITSKPDAMFLVKSGKGLTQWEPTKDFESYKKISLMRNEIRKLPDHELHLPHLDTFLIQDNYVLSTVPDEFFRGMEKLKVLDMSRNDIPSLPRSLEQLLELTMLDLSKNTSLCEISILGKLTCLEILKLKETGITNIPEEIGQLTKLRLLDLSLNRSLCEISILGKLTCLEILNLRWTKIISIPEEIGQLTKLRLLDVDYCPHLYYITPGVISKLIRLEELYLELTKEGNCKFLMELSELKSLIILHLRVPDLHYIPQDFHFETLIEFKITDQYDYYYMGGGGCRRLLEISEFNFSFTMPLMKLIQLSEKLKLHGIKDLDNILPVLFREGCDILKHIELNGGTNVRRLVTTGALGPMKTKGKIDSKLEEIKLKNLDSLEVLWDSPHPYISFSNLADIYIYKCHSLLELFPLSVAQALVNLKDISISDCENLVVVISTTSEIEETSGSNTELVKHEPDDHIVFPFLTKIHLYQLPKLVSFYSGHSIIKYPSLNRIDLMFCDSMKRWSYGENHMPKAKLEHQSKPYSDINDYFVAQLEMDGKVGISGMGVVW